MKRSPALVRIALLAAVLPAAFPACAGEAEPTAAELEAIAFDRQAVASENEIQRWIARLRRETAAFQHFDRAMEAGYSTQITGCMVQRPEGGMGFHYGNAALIDAVVQPLSPEALLYAPLRNGGMKLVAVEFIVPFTAWTDPSPPRLFGMDFKANQTFQVWALHAWIWRDNPSGMFADWNPRVDCSEAK